MESVRDCSQRHFYYHYEHNGAWVGIPNYFLYSCSFLAGFSFFAEIDTNAGDRMIISC